jgi:MDMPI C-terminal domain
LTSSSRSRLPWCVRVDKPLSGTVHIHCTDTEGEWFVHGDGRVERIHARGAAAIRGAASDILLALFTRIPIENLEIIGDATLARSFVEAMKTD